MNISNAIVGLPNVGKSSLFNALTQTIKAQSENYPFCTIEPNIGRVAVPDIRLKQLSTLYTTLSEIPTFIEFKDIAGLVKGASKGEGLGNKFLANIRECSTIIHVLRCFVDEDITHVEGETDPIRDKEIIEIELILADMEMMEKFLFTRQKKAKSGDKEAKEESRLIEIILEKLKEGKPARELKFNEEETIIVKQFNLLTYKPVLYVCNIAEEEINQKNDFVEKVEELAKVEEARVIQICIKLEEEIAQLQSEERKELLETFELKQTGLESIIEESYKLLDLITYFTAGQKECRAWSIKKGTNAQNAAGVIHTDFAKGFIRAEVTAYNDYIENKGEVGAKEKGKTSLEGKEYIVNDGDVMYFRFNV